MSFFDVRYRSKRNGITEVYPEFIVTAPDDLMIRGGKFYAVWDPIHEIWSTDELDALRVVDRAVEAKRKELAATFDGKVIGLYLRNSSNGLWAAFKRYTENAPEHYRELDMDLAFKDDIISKTDYVSKRLPYNLEEKRPTNFLKIMEILYEKEERAKLIWAIGAIFAGDAKHIQKFIVLIGPAGTGKSTYLEVVQMLFEGYYTTFESSALTSQNNTFATEVFKANPLVAIQHDGDLSRITDNSKLNSIVSHEYMTMNEKFKSPYMARVNAFLFMATNKEVRITDSQSGMIRRVIDVEPTGDLMPIQEYQNRMNKIQFELGAIAHYCLKEYREMGKNYYSEYIPISQQRKSNVEFNFLEENFHMLKEQDGAALRHLYDMYKAYCEDSMIQERFVLPYHKFREEMSNYFDTYSDRTRETYDGEQKRNYFSGFKTEKFTFADLTKQKDRPTPVSLVLDCTDSIFDKVCADRPAQLATLAGTPYKPWDDVTTKLNSIKTTQLHYVLLDEQHIVIDFDIKDDDGEKSLELNMQAASKWPATYAEISRSGKGIHLHYIYDGDIEQLSRIYEEDIEIKAFTGKSSLRRQLTLCNDIRIATISSGLPLKGEKEMINKEQVQSERGLRDLIIRNLKKEIHPGTAPSIMFIHKILEDSYKSDLRYDIRDLRPAILAFANNSTNQAGKCISLVSRMKFKSDHEEVTDVEDFRTDEVAFFDVEVFPNLFVVVWKFKGGTKVNMINPSPEAIGDILDLKLIGFNNRRYDNHILYARYLGYDNSQLYELSQRIISNSENATFREAYGLSYTDIYDFSSKKQSLAKFQIELGITHDELHIPWDEPVDEELWPRVVEYCGNDVDATEAVFEARSADWTARQILADLSGLTVNDSTTRHTAQIIFEGDRNPQRHFEYTDLSKEFEGYTYAFGESSYRGEDPKEGGYVYAEPGIYDNVEVLDIQSMHPNTAIHLNVFGKYTKNFKELVEARVAIKHKEYDKARQMLDGKLAPYLVDESKIGNLDNALKIVINIVYGLTSAKFDNPFRDNRNVDNIVAKRGALFMIDLKHAVWEKGYDVAHIKTDSIKLPNASQEIIDFVIDFGAKYGYIFEHENTYDKLALVNNAVYVGKDGDRWDAVGAQFQEPYVYKTLFSKEKIVNDDLKLAKGVTTALHLNMNEDLPEGEDNRIFIGKVGLFTPILPGKGGGELEREKEVDGVMRYYAATGTKGYRWLESSSVDILDKWEDVDHSYFKAEVDKAIATLAEFGDVERFIE